MVLLPECKPEEVRHVLNRLSGLKIEYEGRDVPVAFSAGWTNYRSGESADDLMKRADNVLYFNKRGGKEPTEPKAVPV
jgi:PleD family two-component response regulator